MRTGVVAAFTICTLLFSTNPLSGQGSGSFTQTSLFVTDTAGLAGEQRISYVFLASSMPIQGWTIGICHDNAASTLIGVGDGTATSNVNGGVGPDFVSTTFAADGWIGTVIVDLLSVSSLPPTSGLTELHRAVYQMNVDGSAGTCLCNTLGSPQVSQLIIAGGVPHAPLEYCVPALGLNVPFRRGDANVDGVVGIADVIRILGFLFSQGQTPDCTDAADANDDGGIDLADTIALLTYLFQSGPPFPAPGPQSCGVDTVLDLLPECFYPSC